MSTSERVWQKRRLLGGFEKEELMARSRSDLAKRGVDGTQMENPSTNASANMDGQVNRPSDWPHKKDRKGKFLPRREQERRQCEKVPILFAMRVIETGLRLLTQFDIKSIPLEKEETPTDLTEKRRSVISVLKKRKTMLDLATKTEKEHIERILFDV